MKHHFPPGIFLWAVLIWAFLISSIDHQLCYGCLLEEEEALVELKSSLERSNATPPASWGTTKDCCLWEGVSCSNVTRRVSELFLSYAAQRTTHEPNSTTFNTSSVPWDLDFSIFASFHELRNLDLSCNGIGGTLASKDLSGLKGLEILNLSGNGLTGNIPSSLANFSHLRVLNLEDNSLSGTLPIEVFGKLGNLHELLLSNNQFNGSLTPSMVKLHSLQYVDVSYNLLNGQIATDFFANLTSLQYLDLSHNFLIGSFSFLSLANISKLQVIALSNNDKLRVETNHHGWIPSFSLKTLLLSSCILDTNILSSPTFLSSQHGLQVIDLSYSKLTGNMHSWLFENRTTLENLNLRNNALKGVISLPDNPIISMQGIDVSMNSIVGSLPANIGSIFPQLQYLNLSNNILNGKIPSSLCKMSVLEFLDLSDNNFSGEIPACLVMGSNGWSFMLKLSNNKLHGELLAGVRITYFSRIYLDGNQLTGTFSQNFSDGQALFVLDVHDNHLSGRIPESIGGLSSLWALNLGGNYFEGSIPHQLCNLTNLMLLNLSNNQLSGKMPRCTVPMNVVFLDLANNAFTGMIPDAFSNGSLLRSLDVRNNQFSDNLFIWIQGLRDIRALLLRGNGFEGPVPVDLCSLQYLRLLDLSHNNLRGSIPSCLSNTSFGRLQSDDDDPYWNFDYYMSEWGSSDHSSDPTLVIHNALQEIDFSTKGNTYAYTGALIGLMIGIDISANKLTGNIPPELGNLSRIKTLNLSHNQLSGPIPETFSNLHQIESLDISHNRLTGSIPWQLTQLDSLEVFSVAYNNLSGCVPEFKNQFATFTESSYVGNAGLHGPPLEKTCTPDSSSKMHPEEEEYDDSLDDIIFYTICATSFVLGFWMCIGVLHCCRMGRRIHATVIERYADSFSEKISVILHKLMFMVKIYMNEFFI